MAELTLTPKSVVLIERGTMFSLLKRGTDYQPYVVAYDYYSTNGTWAAGYYFNDLRAAVDFLYENDPKFCNE